MRRYLVVAHQTLTSPELLETMKAKAAADDAAFHLLVPIHHGDGWTWTEGHDRAVANRRLDDALLMMGGEGLAVTGEIGSDSPVASVDDVLRREDADVYDGIVVSTLPQTLSKWLKLDVPSRVQRLTTVPVEHIVGHPADISV
jgi:hypothetical protein